MWLTDLPGYLPPVQIDEVVRAGGVGEVVESKNDDYKVGDLVMGLVGWQQYCVSSCKPEERLRIVPNIVPMPTLLNVLGTTGITAYYGLVELGKPKKGERYDDSKILLLTEILNKNDNVPNIEDIKKIISN